jgi:hypothetical protein
MTSNEELKKLDEEISRVIEEIELLKHRMIKEWKKEKKRQKIKDEITAINTKIQNIFNEIIDLSKE